MTSLEKAIEMFSKDKYATEATKIQIDEVGENYSKVSLTIDDCHKNALGHVMGGVMFTLADFAFAIATNLEGTKTVTLTSQISYLSIPKGERLIAETRLIKDGSRNCFYEIIITDETERQIAVVSTTGAHI